MIRIHNASVVKAGRPLFKNLSWVLQPGEHWVITGPNGSGKTLLLEVLAGVIHPTQGAVSYSFISGDTWQERYDQRRQHIHYIPAHAIQSFLQNYELFYQQRYYSIGDERTPKVRDLFGESVQRLHDLNFPTASISTPYWSWTSPACLTGSSKKYLSSEAWPAACPACCCVTILLKDSTT